MSAPGIVLTDEFEAALTHLNAGGHLLLTGKAGTGKSTLIRHFMDGTDRNVVVAAPTGIAALNVNGYTIHRLFSFHSGLSAEAIRRGDYFPGRFAQTLKYLDTLIIDEASMVRADLFDQIAAALEAFGPTPGRPFGGVQIVLVGDLYQLPPVVVEAEKPYFRTVYDSEYFFSARSYAPEHFHSVQLTHIFRQQGDPRLVEILNDVREGILLDDARAELNRLTQPDFEPPLNEFWLTLTTTNRTATHRNHAALDQLPGPEHTSIAELSGDLTGFEAPTDSHLPLKVGAQVMLLTNDDAGRWVNGTIAHITRLSRDGWDLTAEIRLPDGSLEDVFPHTWEVTSPVVTGTTLSHEPIGSFRQLPFRLAWAITIHKSQGQTLDRVVVDLTGGTFADGQLYVALSRCTSMHGLVLRRSVGPRDLKVDQRVRRFLQTDVPASERTHVYLAIHTVGDSGRMWRPRPIRLAAIDDHGATISTLVNPDRDLGDARARYGLTPSDILLAPLLAQAWAAIAPFLEGKIPVGENIDELLGFVDDELKRNGHVSRIPLGIHQPMPTRARGLTAAAHAPDAAIADAIAVRDAFLAASADGGASSTEPPTGQPFPQQAIRPGYLLTPHTDRPPTFTLAHTHPGDERTEADLAEAMAALLRDAAARAPLTPAARSALESVERRYGVVVLAESVRTDVRIDEVLAPGARVCFSGSYFDAQGRFVDKPELELKALQSGLQPVATVTKTRCEALLTAEAGTLSGKAKNARKYGKPIFTVDDFLDWLTRRGEPSGQSAPR
jgi:hypothetical protein